METWKNEDMETLTQGDMATWTQRNFFGMETWIKNIQVLQKKSNGKLITEVQVIFLNSLAHLANGSLPFVRLLMKKQMEVIRLKTD
jgi:hypothetical protein